MHRLLAAFTLLSLALAAQSPAPKAKPQPKKAVRAVPAFQDLEGGLRVADIRPGKGEGAQAGQTLAVLYRGWLYDKALGRQGRLFDQAMDRRKPFRFPLGAKRVIQGWDRGLEGMKVGAKRVLFIPAELAYGAREIKDDQGKVVIPADSTLVFEVQLLALEDAPAAP